MVSQYSYAYTVVNQVDEQYIGKRNEWATPENATGHNGSTNTHSQYTKSGSTYKKPHILAVYDFQDINIPEEAEITNMYFEVRIRSTASKLNPKCPVGTFLDYHSDVKDTGGYMETGFYNHAYRYAPTSKLTTNYNTVKYGISKENLKKLSGSNEKRIKMVNGNRFGLLLNSHDFKGTGEVRINWVKLVVEYELPSPYVKYSISTDVDNPTKADVGTPVKVDIEFGNSSIASMADQTLQVDIPYGFVTNSLVIGGDTVYYDLETHEWTVSGKSKSKNNLSFEFIPNSIKLKTFNVSNERIGDNKGYVWVNGNPPDDYSEGYIEHSTLQQGEPSCVDAYMTWTSNDSHANPYLQLEDWVANSISLSENDIISVEVTSSNDEVYLIDYSLQNTKVMFDIHVPTRLDVDIAVHVCYYPRKSGTQHLEIPQTRKQVEVLPPKEYTLKLATDEDGNCLNVWKLTENRFITNVDTDLDVIPIGFDEFCKDLYLENTTLKLDQWKKRSYIGCVETEHSHFDPKSTFEDDLLNEHYKNMQYIGKANEYDEDITLNIRLRPHQVPTVQGLIKIDKPIPINLVPTAFEGDPLNHRGWVEITKIVAEKTNPLWDKCEIDVKYITHNIISRFNIFRGKKANEYELPNVFNNALSTGEDITEFFDVVTDGSYIYDEEEEVYTHRNMFSISNGQNIVLTSKNVLGSKCSIDFYWDTLLFSELRENNIQRLIQLVNENGDVVFEYEYYDFDFTDDVYTCMVQGRLLTDSGYDVPISNEIFIHSDVEHTEDESDEDYDEYDLDVYGSQTRFSLDANLLTIREFGFSGNELEVSRIPLISGNYTLRVEFRNNNNDADTGNVLNWFDFVVDELAYNNSISQYYSNLVVSPYPVPNKRIVFVRESEEGTIYYLEDDGSDFKFLLEPFYQYLCGVDLKTDTGIQIFDFNNSYSVVYMVNGLIRFGVNRINGDLYLDKWDSNSRTYIRTNRFRITKFDDVEVVRIDDDMITIQISDIEVTMWRGRPYVAIKHETEDIQFLDTFNMAFADGINDEVYAYPQYWNLVNSKNKFPECIGGTNLIKSSCMELSIEESELMGGEFTIIPNRDSAFVGEEVILNIVNVDVADGEVSLIANEEVIGVNVGQQVTASISDVGLTTIYAVHHGNDTVDMMLSNMVTIDVTPFQSKEEGDVWSFLPVPYNNGEYKYNQGSFDFQLLHNGQGVQGIPVDVYNPNQTWHLTTNSNGIVTGTNNKIVAGTYTIRATAIDDGVLLGEALYKVKISEVKTKITGVTLKFMRGQRAKFKLTDEDDNPIPNASVSISVNGTKYMRQTSDLTASEKGVVSVKFSKKGYYTAKVKFAGDKGRYKSVTKSFNIEVK